jgi:hypothetical protein
MRGIRPTPLALHNKVTLSTRFFAPGDSRFPLAFPVVAPKIPFADPSLDALVRHLSMKLRFLFALACILTAGAVVYVHASSTNNNSAAAIKTSAPASTSVSCPFCDSNSTSCPLPAAGAPASTPATPTAQPKN